MYTFGTILLAFVIGFGITETDSLEHKLLFLHFHKAGGSSVIRSLFASGLNGVRDHRNGNPFHVWGDINLNEKYIVRPSQLTPDELLQWINTSFSTTHTHDTDHDDADFFAMEYNFFAKEIKHVLPLISSLEQKDIAGRVSPSSPSSSSSSSSSSASFSSSSSFLPRFQLLTILRDPWDRFVSNLRWSGTRETTTCFNLNHPPPSFPLSSSPPPPPPPSSPLSSSLSPPHSNTLVTNFQRCNLSWGMELEFQHKFRGMLDDGAGTRQTFPVSYNKDNYYVRMLNGLGYEPHVKMKRTHLARAKRQLSHFDILILENKRTHDLLRCLNLTHPRQTSLPISHANTNTNTNSNINTNTNTNTNVNTNTNTNVNLAILLSPLSTERDSFVNRNTLDYELYRYATQLALSKLSLLEC